jgi:hypothetical protein
VETEPCRSGTSDPRAHICPYTTMSATHLGWMQEAILMVSSLSRSIGPKSKPVTQAEEALAANEVPIGCVFVRDGAIIAKARNRTNELRNVPGSYSKDTTLLPAKFLRQHGTQKSKQSTTCSPTFPSSLTPIPLQAQSCMLP